MEWVKDVREHGLGTPGWLPGIPYIGNSLATWWQTNLAQPGAAQALLGRGETTGIFSLTRTVGVQVASRLTILVFTVLTLFFLYRDGPSVMEQAQAIAERLFGPPGGRLGKDAISAVRGTVNGLVLVGLAEGLVLGIAYAVAGLHHVVLLGLAIGSTTRLPFLWVLLGIFGGLETFGLLGLFLGPAIISILLAIWRDGTEKPAV
jgi:predicted PurR-regulated permease PerM